MRWDLWLVGSLVKFFLVFWKAGEFTQGGHGFEDVPINHGPRHTQIFGDKLGRLVFEFYPFKDFKLAQRYAVAQILDQGGQ